MKKVLLAFKRSKDLDDIVLKFANEFKRKGFAIEIAQEFSFSRIENFLHNNEVCTTLILQEYLDHNNPVRPENLYKLKQKFPKLNIIYIIDNRHHKSDYVRHIFDSNIYNSLFIKDASIENIVYICLNPRKKTEAEYYYGLENSNASYHGVNNNKLEFSSEFIKKNMYKAKDNKRVIVKEKIIYKTPRDYQKVIGISSPYSVGKTVIAANLAKFYTKHKVPITLIDTDFIKKDLIYYFRLGSEDFLKLVKLNKDISNKKDIHDLKKYTIEIDRLKLFIDHRDSKYQINFEMINTIVRNSDTNVIIIDISKDLDPELTNEILSICDERVIVSDKMISTLNGLPYKLNLKKYNRKNLSLVINRDVKIKSFSNKEIKQHFKEIELFGKESFSLDFDDVFFIPNKLKLIAEAIANREVAYGMDQEFDASIEKLGLSLYHINTSKSNKKSILGKLLKK